MMENKLEYRFCCSVCDGQFTEKGNLTRHYRNVHGLASVNSKEKSKGKFGCNTCDAMFSTRGNLTRHCNEKHSLNNNEEVIITCPACTECFTRSHSLIRHMDRVHKDKCGICLECSKEFPDLKSLYKHSQEDHKPADQVETDKIVRDQICKICSKGFTCRQSLNRHKRNIHKIESAVLPSKICPLCGDKFATMGILSKHLVEVHSVELHEERLNFESVEDFKQWKLDIEREDLAFFCFKNSSENRTYYECHRSGLPQHKTANPGTRLKSTDSTKMKKHCPARIIVTNVDGRIHVYFQRTHVGHTHSIRLRSTKDKRMKLAGRIRAGVAFNRVTNDENVTQAPHIKESVSPLSRFDKLLNLARKYATTASEEAVSEAVPQLKSIIKLLRQNQVEETQSFLKLTNNRRGNKVVEKLKLQFIRKKLILSSNSLAKPSTIRKSSAQINSERCGDVYNDGDEIWI